MPFDLSMWKLLVLGLIALVVFGPDRLPEIARDAGPHDSTTPRDGTDRPQRVEGRTR